MKKIFLGIFTFAFIVAACGGGGGPTGIPPTPTSSSLCPNDYFPVVNGASWTYAGTGPSGDFNWTSTISDATTSGFTMNNQFDTLSTTQQWSCTSEGLSALQFGSGPEATLTATGVTGVFETTDSSGVSFPNHISVGDTWTQSFTIHGDMTITEGATATADGTITQDFNAVGMESVSVPAGTFDALKLEVTVHFDLQISMGGGVTIPVAFDSSGTNWLVQNVGWVKAVSSATIEGGDAIDSTTELQTFNIP